MSAEFFKKTQSSTLKNKLKRQSTSEAIEALEEHADQASTLETHPFFHAAKTGASPAEFDALLEWHRPDRLSKYHPKDTGAFGESILHICCLYRNFELAKHVAERLPMLVPAAYGKEPYLGETALHIAVVLGNPDMVEFLLAHGAPPNDLCLGKFFGLDGSLYLGGYPLSFAAAIDNPSSEEILDLLVHHGAAMERQDEWGNTALHVLVIKGNIRMYDYLLTRSRDSALPLRAEAQEDLDRYMAELPPGSSPSMDSVFGRDPRSLESIENRDGFTPLLLSAFLGKGEVFEFIVHRRRVRLWSYGPISAYVYPLDEIDTHTETRWNRHKVGALELTVYHCPTFLEDEERFRQHVEMLRRQPFKEMLRQKWAFARPWFRAWAIEYLLFLVVYTASISLRPAEWLHELVPSVTVGLLELLVLLHVGASVYVETRDFLFIPSYYFSNFRLFTLLAWMSNLSFLGALFFRLDQSRAMEEVCLAVSVTASYLYSLNIARKLPGVSAFVVIITEVFSADLPLFLMLYLVVLVGFSSGFHLLLPLSGDGDPGLVNIMPTVYKMFEVTINGYGEGAYQNARLQLATLLALIAFTLTSSVLMLNLFIAMISSTYQRNMDDRRNQTDFAHAALTLFMERRMPTSPHARRTGKTASEYGRKDSEGFFLYVEEKDSGRDAPRDFEIVRFVEKRPHRPLVTRYEIHEAVNLDTTSLRAVRLALRDHLPDAGSFKFLHVAAQTPIPYDDLERAKKLKLAARPLNAEVLEVFIQTTEPDVSV